MVMLSTPRSLLCRFKLIEKIRLLEKHSLVNVEVKRLLSTSTRSHIPSTLDHYGISLLRFNRSQSLLDSQLIYLIRKPYQFLISRKGSRPITTSFVQSSSPDRENPLSHPVSSSSAPSDSFKSSWVSPNPNEDPSYIPLLHSLIPDTFIFPHDVLDKNIEEDLHQAHQLIQSNSYSSSLDLLQDQVNRQPSTTSSPSLLLALAFNFLLLRQPSSALNHLDQLLVSHPDLMIALTCKAISLAELGRIESSIGFYQAALKQNDRHVVTNIFLGKTLEILDRTEDAIFCFRKAILINNQHLIGYLHLTRAYFNKKEYKQAMDIIESALDIDCNNPDLLYGKAHCLMHLNQHGSALTVWEQSLKHPLANRCEIWFQKAICHRAREEYEQAITCLDNLASLIQEMASSEGGGDQQLSCGLLKAECWQYLKNHDQAIEILDSMLALDPKNIKALEGKAISLYALGKEEEAKASWSKACEIKQELAQRMCQAGLYFLEKGNEWIKALSLFDMALQFQENYPSARYGRAITLYFIKSFEAAAKEFQWVTENSPNKTMAWYYLGQCYQQLDQFPHALNCYNQGLTKEPDHILCLLRKASILKASLELEEAMEIYDKVLKLEPNNSEALHAKKQSKVSLIFENQQDGTTSAPSS